jgi:hypothetical protein
VTQGLPQTVAEIDAAVVAAEVRLTGHLEELEAAGRDTGRLLELVRGVEAQLALLRERKERLLASEASPS